MDLLSVLMHEFGHLLGHDHDEGVMAETLDAGQRPTGLNHDYVASVDHLLELSNDDRFKAGLKASLPDHFEFTKRVKRRGRMD